jgi:hypothetical protein
MCSYLEVKLPVHEGGHSSVGSPEFKNEWSCATTPLLCLDGWIVTTYRFEHSRMNLQAKPLEYSYIFGCLFHYVYLRLDNFPTGTEFHTTFYQYLVQVCSLEQFSILTKDIINYFCSCSHSGI